MSRSVTVDFGAMPRIEGQPALTFVRLAGTEVMGRLFTYTVELKTPDQRNSAYGPAADLNLKEVLGQMCTVTIQLPGKAGGGDGERKICGLITSAKIKKAEGRHILYALTLRPWLWLATRTTDFKIFQEKSALEILDEVLGDYAYPVEKKLNGDYPQRDYQVQYGESDFQFLQRLMQEWGIYWYFEHSDGQHTLVLCDHPGAHSSLPASGYDTVLYHPADHRLDEECLTFFDAAESLTSGSWVSSDFDFTKPLADLTSMSSQPRETSLAEAEVYEWPGDYHQASEGDALARVRMEERRMRGARCHGEGPARGVVVGCTVTLTGHPHSPANQEYLILSTELELEDVAEESGQQNFHQHTRFEVQPATEPFRPERSVAKPHTHGPQTATVTGPSGQEIWTDKYGRIKVQFHWDRYGKKDEQSSCWVRVSHPWAGSHFGMIHTPRIGQEVVVDFLNGDPDCPLVTGRVYNAVNMPPWALPDNATQSGILTRSSKEGSEANANALRFEDKKGEEEVWLHAEKDQRIEVENDESHFVGHDRAKQVDNDETVNIGHDRKEEVGNDESITIGNDQTILVKNDQSTKVQGEQCLTVLKDRDQKVLMSESTLVAKDQKNSVGNSRQDTVGAKYSLTIGASAEEQVGSNKKLTVGSNMDVSVTSNITTKCTQRKDTISKNLTQEIGEALGIKAGKTCTLDVGEQLEITCGKSSISMDKDGNIMIKGKELTFHSSKDQMFKADGDIVLKGSNIKEN